MHGKPLASTAYTREEPAYTSTTACSTAYGAA